MGLLQQYLLSAASDELIEENTRMLYAVISIFLSLSETIFLLLITPQVIYQFHNNSPSMPFWAHIKKHFKPVVIETFRALGKSAVGFVMLIVPGIQRVIYYLFVPFVVQFNSHYQLGQIDALEESKKLIKTNFLLFFSLFILTNTALIIVEVLLARWNIFVNPLAWAALTLFNIALEVFITTILVTTYEITSRS